MVQISKILNAHMDSLQWIDQNTNKLKQRVKEVSQVMDTQRREQEHSFHYNYEWSNSLYICVMMWCGDKLSCFAFSLFLHIFILNLEFTVYYKFCKQFLCRKVLRMHVFRYFAQWQRQSFGNSLNFLIWPRSFPMYSG
jgi:hypothetical protein